MLSVVDLDRGRAEYYLARAKLEYLQGEGADGLWYGKGATSLGLSGKVEPDKFRSLFRGYLDGRKLVHSAGRENHFAGVDLAFSAPKAVSALWAVSESRRRATIEDCQLRAVKAALHYLEENATQVRLGRGGQERLASGMVATLWMHGSSRAEEPQLHHHATVFNVGVFTDCESTKTRTLASELYFKHKMAGGAVYRAEF